MNYEGNNIQGWMHGCELEFLYNIVQTMKKNSIVVEIGSWKGRSAHALASGIKNSNKKMKLFCVDTFLGVSGNVRQTDEAKVTSIREIFENNMKDFDYNILQLTSEEASRNFKDGSISLIFLDCDHSYESTSNDLNLWFPKLKKGGLFVGHDYNEETPGCFNAVNEYFSNDYVIEKVKDSIFVVKK
jgi:predicted O-methyltransferase YrrM